MNKSKTKLVSCWRCHRQAGAMKALQRVVWSLIFLGFGVHLVKAEEQGSQVQQRMDESKRLLSNSPSRRPMEEVDASLETCEGKNLRETTRVRTQAPLKETARVVTLVHLKQTARTMTREPSKSQWKDGKFRCQRNDFELLRRSGRR